MKEDLGFEGDQLNQINTCFTVGYVNLVALKTRGRG